MQRIDGMKLILGDNIRYDIWTSFLCSITGTSSPSPQLYQLFGKSDGKFNQNKGYTKEIRLC